MIFRIFRTFCPIMMLHGNLAELPAELLFNLD